MRIARKETEPPEDDESALPAPRAFTVPDGAPPARLDAWLAAVSGISRARVQKHLRAGEVAGPGGLPATEPRRKVAPGETYVLRAAPPAPVALVPQDIPLSVLYEDDAILVVDKPAGLVVHPAAGHPDGTLVNAVLHRCPGVLDVGGEGRPGIVHRLDRDTSGAIVVAKTDAALEGLAAAFRAGEVRKTYLAILSGVPEPPAGHLESNIGRSPSDRQKMAILARGGKPASTDYEVAEDFGSVALARIRIHTGRTHQIRVHMASIGCPVAGDPVYGSPSLDRALPFRPARQMLHAWRLALPHPLTGAPLSLEAPVPSDFAALLSALRAPPPPRRER